MVVEETEKLNVEVCDLDSHREDVEESWWRSAEIFQPNIYMLPTKFTYFFWGGLIGTWQIFINPFFKSVGLSSSQAGIITGMTFVTSSIAGPLWGILTDYTNHRKYILAILSLCSAAGIGSIPFVAYSFCDLSKNTGNISLLNNGSKTVESSCSISAKENLYFVSLFFMIFGAVFFNTLPNFIEAIVMDVVNSSRRKATYGGQRICGAIGTCVFIQISGVLADKCQLEGMSPFTSVFILYAPLALIMIPTGSYLIRQFTTNSSIVKSNTSVANVDQTISKHLSATFRQFDVIFFMLTVLVAGLAFNLMIYFGFLLVNEQIENVTSTEIGLVFVTAEVSSILLFPFTSRLIEILSGPHVAITIGICFYCIRYVAMALTTAYWLMILLQIFHCFSFALLWSAMMEHVDEIAPKKIKVTMIIILQTVHFGVSPIFLNMLGGAVHKRYNGKTLFSGTGILCGVWGLLLVIYQVMKYYRDNKQINRDTKQCEPSADESNSSTGAIEMDVVLEDTNILMCPS